MPVDAASLWKYCRLYVKTKESGIVLWTFIGLSKERPILGDHPKAHIHEIWQISWNLADFMKSSRFYMKSGFHVKSTYKTYKSNISRKTLQFYWVLWKGYVMFSHEIHWILKDQLPAQAFDVVWCFMGFCLSSNYYCRKVYKKVMW